jgi:hypothetical protein
MRRDNPGKQSATTRGWGTLSGIEPEKGKGISSPGMYEASLMWPRNHQSGNGIWQTSAAFSAIRRCQPGRAKKQRVIAIAFRCRPEREKLSSVDSEVF